MTDYLYRAFISYNHQDKAWAESLQRALENYRVPRRLLGQEGPFGPIPERLSPVFRDREDLSSASDLSQAVREQLEQSETLVVVCSPHAARSHWVNAEIRYFRSLGRSDRIYCMIVNGDPDDKNSEYSCFPPALWEGQGEDPRVPLAADARKFADGKSLAKLKLVAGILGIRLDELRRRDMQRRRRNQLITGLSATLGIVLTVLLAFTAITSRQSAELQRAGTEELLSYMLGNLKSLDPIVGLEVIDQNNEEVMYYLENLNFREMENETLVDTALQWRDEGQVQRDRGELKQAMKTFQKSKAAFIELHQREGGSTRALFELGQAEFWVGYVHYETGDLDRAQESFTRYGAITRRLVNADPKDAAMVMELALSLTNLSIMERTRQNPDREKSLELIQSAMQYNQIALVLDPENSYYRRELANTTAFLAVAWLETCNLGKAFEYRQQNVALSRQLYEESPEDSILKTELAYALSGFATVQRQMALADQALEGLRESEDLLSTLVQDDPGNLNLKWEVLLRQERIANLLAATGAIDEAWEMSGALADGFKAAMDEGKSEDFTAAVEYADFRIDHSELAFRRGDAELAGSELEAATELLFTLVTEKPDNRIGRYQLARAGFEAWRQKQGGSAGGNPLLEGFLVDPAVVKSCSDASLAARLAVMRGDKAQASRYTSYLLNKGFFDPEFVGFCRAQGICEHEQ